MKTPMRNFYESAVDSAWLSYDDAVGKVYQQYHDAFALGHVEREDGSMRVRNAELVKCWEKLMNNLDRLWLNYQQTGDGGSRLQSILIRSWKSPGGFIPMSDDGRTLKAKIKSNSPHHMYTAVDEIFKSTGLFCHKFHNGYRILAGDEDEPILDDLMTSIPQSETITTHGLNK
jgi:hypothetical protein